jgi:hypothetical protein
VRGTNEGWMGSSAAWIVRGRRLNMLTSPERRRWRDWPHPRGRSSRVDYSLRRLRSRCLSQSFSRGSRARVRIQRRRVRGWLGVLAERTSEAAKFTEFLEHVKAPPTASPSGEINAIGKPQAMREMKERVCGAGEEIRFVLFCAHTLPLVRINLSSIAIGY